MVKILDISEFQPNINYDQLKHDVDYVIIRTSYGTEKVDEQITEHIQGVIRAGIPYGLYHYALYEGGRDTINEAHMLVHAHNQAKGMGRAPTFLFVDVEESHSADIVKETNRFIDEVWHETHCNIGLYTGDSFESAHHLERVDTCMHWIARYGVNNGHPTQCPHEAYNIWQYTSVGRVAGIAGDVDLSTCSEDTLTHLKRGECPGGHAIPKQDTGQYVYFPAGQGNWRVYPTNKTAEARYAIGSINPSQFGGLTYRVRVDHGNYVYEIQTGAFGRVKVYCAPVTGAKVSWHGSNGWPNVQD